MGDVSRGLSLIRNLNRQYGDILAAVEAMGENGTIEQEVNRLKNEAKQAELASGTARKELVAIYKQVNAANDAVKDATEKATQIMKDAQARAEVVANQAEIAANDTKELARQDRANIAQKAASDAASVIDEAKRREASADKAIAAKAAELAELEDLLAERADKLDKINADLRRLTNKLTA